MTEERKMVSQFPENSETPMSAVRSWVTPTRLFFVRSHFPNPQIKLEDWRLEISGCVDQPLSLSYDDLSQFPPHVLFNTIECAGNGRSFLINRADGVQWGAGAIAHGEWSGVRLKDVLEKAGVQSETVEIICTGADSGIEKGPDPISFVRGLPLEKALHPDTLLATHLNGEPLDENHGFPARLIVPGWYGVASVKWLISLEASAVPYDGYFQTTKYMVGEQTDAGVERIGVQQIRVKSEIVRPKDGEILAPGTNRISGVAWAGEHAIARVDVSTDGGVEWHEAELIGMQAPYSWTFWELHWEQVSEGPYMLMARATSASGETQPLEHNNLSGGYLINFVRPRHVEIRGDKEAKPERSGAEAAVYDMWMFAEQNAELPLDVELQMELIGGAGI